MVEAVMTPRKFRVWDGEEMHEPPHDFSIHGDGSLHIPVHIRMRPGRGHIEDGYEVMQYTGLNDAEDSEIWEGDFIRRADRVIEVTYCEHGAAFVFGDEFYEELTGGRWTVIGNRYENPDLLKEAA